MVRRSAPVLLLLLTGVACTKDAKDSGGSPSPATSATVPSDAMTVDAFKAKYPSFSAAGKGQHVKIHGYSQTSGGRIAISPTPDKPIPFAFCTPATPPKLTPGVRSHVVAEGTLDDKGDLEPCTLTIL